MLCSVSVSVSSEIYAGNLRGAASTDRWIQNGTVGGESFEPRFTVHGFRYIEILGMPIDASVTVEAVVVHSDIGQARPLDMKNQVLNQIQQNIQWSQRTNLMSLPTDCHQRDERKGWTGDASLTVDEALFNFNNAMPVFAKFLDDMRAEQVADGALGDTAPLSFGKNPADPNWAIAYPAIMWAIWTHYKGQTARQQQHS